MGITNNVTHLTAENFKAWHETLYEYQTCIHNDINQPIRNILKHRMAAMSTYFAIEAFEQAVLTGESQTFFTTSESSSEMLLSTITDFAKREFGITLIHDDQCLVLHTKQGQTALHFTHEINKQLPPSSHVYMDEYFWMEDFKNMNAFASGMAALKKYRKTYYSSLSLDKNIEKTSAYKYWNKTNGQARYVLTVENSLNNFNIEELKSDFSYFEFMRMFMCDVNA